MNRRIFSNVASCALQRWAVFSGKPSPEDQRRARDEKETAIMAMDMARKAQ